MDFPKRFFRLIFLVFSETVVSFALCAREDQSIFST